jgi:hypothetical protein
LSGQGEGAAQETVGPGGVDAAAMAEHVDGAASVGATQEDDVAGGDGGRIGPPRRREGATERAISMTALAELSDVGVDEAVAAEAHLVQALEVKTMPDLALPEAIEVFDGGLEARLARWSENGGNPEGEAEANNPADGSRRMRRAMKAQVVVELRIERQTGAAPMVHQRIDDGERGPMRSEHCQAGKSAQRPSGEDIERAGFAQAEAFDEVKAVELGVRGRQIPAGWRGQLTPSRFGVHESLGVQNAMDRARAWHPARQQGLESGPHRRGPDKAEVILGQLAADSADEPLSRAGGPRRIVFRTGGSIEPINFLQRHTPGAAHPELHRGKTNSKIKCRPPGRVATAMFGHEQSPQIGREFFSCRQPCAKNGQKETQRSGPSPAPLGPLLLGVTDTSWLKSDRDVVAVSPHAQGYKR